MTECFADLFEESLKKLKMYPGAIVRGEVVAIDRDFVTVAAGLKSESVIPIEEFRDSEGAVDIKVGDMIEVAVDSPENGLGETELSREKAKRVEAWNRLVNASESGKTVLGIITGKVKGGFTVEIENIRAFLPGSLVDVRPVRDTSYLEGKELEFKVIKLDAKRNNVVVSRRSVVEAENSAERAALLENLNEGQEVVGIVKNLTDYGAFVDLGGVDGLLHITDMAWKRVKHPSEVVGVGDEIRVKILKFDRERNRVSLGIKQLGDDPWSDIARRFPEGTRLTGKVTNITDYGCFVEIETGIEGLVHVSEMDWTNKNVHPSKVVQLSDEIEVVVLEVDSERRRISLGIKQCRPNPWEAFAATHERGSRIQGQIKSITDFGIFIGLEGEIDGLVHLSDISWNEKPEVAVRQFKKGQDLEAVILTIDAERERISLGIKQLAHDPYSQFAADHAKGTIISGTVTEVDAKHAVVDLGDTVIGHLRAAEYQQEAVDDLRNFLREGDSLEAKIVGMDRKNRIVNLSVKAKDTQEQAEALESFNRDSENNVSNTTLGDLLKEQMEGKA